MSIFSPHRRQDQGGRARKEKVSVLFKSGGPGRSQKPHFDGNWPISTSFPSNVTQNPLEPYHRASELEEVGELRPNSLHQACGKLTQKGDEGRISAQSL
jgi:hypothetical protein